MKKYSFLSLFVALSINMSAVDKNNITRYQTFIYTSDQLDDLIQQEEQTRGYIGDLLGATLEASKGVAGGYVTAIVDLGVGAVKSFFTRNADNKKQWEEIVSAENSYEESLATEQSINDFYAKTSAKSPMDPLGMKFDGIGCLRKNGDDTVFYISCHINRDKISRIINHSKFELSLDTLIINPMYCSLPNSEFDTIFSYDRRDNLRIALDMKLTSSWINLQTQIQQDVKLGKFSLVIPVDRKTLNKQGMLHYVRTYGEPAKYKIEGESFIVPRSYMGYRDANGVYQDSWGTGEYKVEINLKENCNTAAAYRKNWKADYKARKKAAQQGSAVQRTWKVIKSQVWDEYGKQWVLTTVKAPADMFTDDLKKLLNSEIESIGR